MSGPRIPDRPRATLKTYSHLQSGRRMPSEYEIATSQLLPYLAPSHGGFATDVPLADWYARWQRGSPFRSSDWERFADPRETTYTRYVTLARDREVFIDGLFTSMHDASYARGLATGWPAVVAASLFPLRFALHGLQMVAAYVGHMAPGGRIAITCALQAADEVRRIQRIAYRMAVARQAHPDVEARARVAWQSSPAWQPLRETIERLLVTWDWGEAFVGLNLAVKPWVDALVCATFAARARSAGDALLGEALRSLAEDAAWHRAWSRALLPIADTEGSAAAVASWAASWRPAAERAARALAPVFSVDPDDLARDAGTLVAETGAP